MKVILLGSSGLIGGQCLKFTANDLTFSSITILNRQKTETNFLKVEEVIFDFDNPQNQKEKIVGDVLICCLGTTIRKAKSKEAFKKVDFEYPVNIAKLAFANGVKHFVVISSIGANSKSNSFYLKTKGEMENEISKIPFESISILRPSILFGDREEFRLGEKIGIFFTKIIQNLFFGSMEKYKGIEAETIAIAINKLIKQNKIGINIYESDQIKNIAIN